MNISELAFDDLPLHDSVIESVEIDPARRLVSIVVRTAGAIHKDPGTYRIDFDGARGAQIPLDQPWGPSASVLEQSLRGDRYEIQIQSGDLIVVRASGLRVTHIRSDEPTEAAQEPATIERQVLAADCDGQSSLSCAESFASVASDFCNWCESATESQEFSALVAADHMSTLCRLGLTLGMPDSAEADGEDTIVPDGDWRRVFERCSSLPFSYYRVVFDPHESEGAEPVLGDLGDDIADVYRDLSQGLCKFRSGRVEEAERDWCLAFWSHWGRHSASAFYALHCWISDTGDGQPPNKSLQATR